VTGQKIKRSKVMNKYCPRCAHYTLETLRTHVHCFNCNYNPECSALNQNYDQIPHWVIPYLNEQGLAPRRKRGLGGKRLVANMMVLFALAVTSGCLAKKDNVTVEYVPTPISPKLDLFGFEAIVKAFPDFNRYSVSLKWPNEYLTDSWAITRQSKKENISLGTLDKSKNYFEDSTVSAGEIYTYFLNALEKDNLKVIGERTVTIPLDYLVDEKVFPAELKNINRVFIPKGTKLKSNGKNLKWNINEAFGEDFTIDTSPPFRRLNHGEDGDSCSVIEIKAKTISGSMHVDCTPQDGADGADGKNGKHGEPGKKGQAGDVELKPANEWKAPLNEWQVANLKNWYVAGQLPTGTKPDRYSWEMWFRCSKAPTKGGDGEKGGHGQDGGTGGKGGNSSRMVFEIQEPIPFSLSHSTKVGKGGLGGRGGNSGKGGVGGPPGDQDPSGFLCPANTEFGKTGEDGRNGREGKEGLKGLRWITKWIYKNGGTCGGQCK
jgi:hypothetical protein